MRREKNFVNIKKIIVMINYIFDNLPRLYYTRAGCEIEEFDTEYHSDHDAVRNIGALIISKYNELMIDLSVGSYNSAVGCTRSIFEWLLRTIAVVSDRSILTTLPSDKNKPTCFAGLMKMIQYGRWKKIMTEDDKKRIQDFLKHTSKTKISNPEVNEFTDLYIGTVRSRIPHGIGEIPNKLNDLILKNIVIQNPFRKELLHGKEALYVYYDIVSEHIHKDIENLYTEPGGRTIFIDLKEFDDAYSQIILMSDLILYFYLILIDLDVFHSNRDENIRWRKKAKKILKSFRLSSKQFASTNSLLVSPEWNSKPPISFAYNFRRR